MGLRIISSMNMKNSLPPSSAGMGRRLNRPTLIAISAIIVRSGVQSIEVDEADAASAT